MAELRHLVVVLGDQLDRTSSAWDGFDPATDVAWMCEASEESTHVWSSRQRIAVFLSAMRHFAQALVEQATPLIYRRLGEGSLAAALADTLGTHAVRRVVITQPGDWRVLQALRSAVSAAGVEFEVREDRHFFCSIDDFRSHLRGRKTLRMEYFYRDMRRRHRVLMEAGRSDKPVGGAWNFDADNRASFGVNGPGFLPQPLRFVPDGLTLEVMATVDEMFGDHPGSLATFGWPVTRDQALQALHDFISERLPLFGHWQDAMWGGEPWLYHSQVSVALNLKLLNPREVVAAAENAYRTGAAPLPAVEGFIRQVLGWREYVRGVYWTQMPDYLHCNELGAELDLPAWYWTADVPMRCLRDALAQTLEHGYAHHIQRLMVTGLYALLLGVRPQQVHGWYLSVYVDAVEWVELPNTLGMSQYADGGLMASKPYVASGRYIERMSDHCRGCRFVPGERTGPRACPYTTLYWDFLMRHAARFEHHPRMAGPVRLARAIPAAERTAIAIRAAAVRRGEWSEG